MKTLRIILAGVLLVFFAGCTYQTITPVTSSDMPREGTPIPGNPFVQSADNLFWGVIIYGITSVPMAVPLGI
jgi:hypothetical protein